MLESANNGGPPQRDASAWRYLRLNVPRDVADELQRRAVAGDRTLAAEARRALRLYAEDEGHRDEVTR
jgi:hypothetical protein